MDISLAKLPPCRWRSIGRVSFGPTVRLSPRGAGALNVLSSPMLFLNRRVIIERAAELRLPAVYQWPETAEEGGLRR
jgi:hypothetical protein